MRVAIDHSPLVSQHKFAHKIRGTGFYTKNLINALTKYHPENEYELFVQGQKVLDADIFHIPYFEPFFLSLPFKKQGKTVVTIHDLTPIVFPELFPAGLKGKIKYLIQSKIVKFSDAIITDSESSKKDIQHFLKIPASKIHSIPLAADEIFKRLSLSSEEKQNIRKKYRLPERFALYVGDATPNKNLKRLVEASISAKVPLVMIGSALVGKEIDMKNVWNKDLLFVQDAAEKNKNIFLLGFLSSEELVKLYNTATFFVFPSFYEGFGLPLLEAAACGLPVLTSNKSSIPEVIEDAAFYIDPLDVSDIQTGMQELLENTTLRQDLSEKGLLQSKKFSWEKTANETVKVYEEIHTKSQK